MGTIYYDPACTDEERRRRALPGRLFIYSPPRPATPGGSAPRRHGGGGLRAARPAPTVKTKRSRWSAYAASPRRAEAALHPSPGVEGAAPRDPPRASAATPSRRTSTCRGCGRLIRDDYLTSGIAYAFHPHRDTWYSAPMPDQLVAAGLSDVRAGELDGLPPGVFRPTDRQLVESYNYYEWNTRAAAAPRST